jgi:hypothetical protein
MTRALPEVLHQFWRGLDLFAFWAAIIHLFINSGFEGDFVRNDGLFGLMFFAGSGFIAECSNGVVVLDKCRASKLRQAAYGEVRGDPGWDFRTGAWAR